jgi:hypothetical protein
MSDQNNQPLSVSLSTEMAKTSVPLIADGVYAEFRLTELTQQDIAGKGASTKWKFELVKPTVTTEGTPMNPGDFGSMQFVNIQLYAKADAKDPQWFVKKIAQYQDALLGTGDPGNAKGKPTRPNFDATAVSQMLGKTLIAKMKVKTGEYVGNEFASVMFPGDVKA